MRAARLVPLLLAAALAGAQDKPAVYDILLKHGRVLDPGSARDGRFDVAIANRKIARIAADLPPTSARVVVDVGGCVVTPGLIDLNASVDPYGARGVNPDHNALRSGVTTVVDGGSSGWKNVEQFKARVVDHSRARVLLFLSAASEGTSGDVDPEAVARAVKQHAALIVGIRAAGDARTLDAALRAARVADRPLMVDTRAPVPDLLARLRPGDVVTRIFAADGRLFGGNRRSTAVEEAQRRGILFDVGHGSDGFAFPVAMVHIDGGFRPDTISTAMDRDSILLARTSMTVTLSKLLNLGMKLEELVERATIRPARAIGRPELGSLAEGRDADVAVLALETGRFAYLDSAHAKLTGDRSVRAVLTIRAGQIVWDPDARSRPDWISAGPYSNYR